MMNIGFSKQLHQVRQVGKREGPTWLFRGSCQGLCFMLGGSYYYIIKIE